LTPAARALEAGPGLIRSIGDGASPAVIPLALGEPSWALPAPARRALADAAERPGACAYGPNDGLPGLRAAVAEHHGAHPEEVLITCGAQGALHALYRAWLGPGDEVLVPDPGFPAYRTLARLVGAESVAYRLRADAGFELEAAAVAEALERAPRARVAVVNHPANPTGAVASSGALAEVAELCAARGVLLVSDEVYRELWFDRRPAGLRDTGLPGVVVSSVSKGWAAPGLRVGWAVGGRERLAPARAIHAAATTAACRPAQEAARALLESSPEVLAGSRFELGLRWATLSAAFGAQFGLTPVRPAGGFYLWWEMPEAVADDPLGFCYRLRDEAGVLVVPGMAFGDAGRRHLRLSFAAAPEALDEGVRRLAPFWPAGPPDRGAPARGRG
jgi:aspartate/methionine/tyrosine aminotransferase